MLRRWLHRGCGRCMGGTLCQHAQLHSMTTCLQEMPTRREDIHEVSILWVVELQLRELISGRASKIVRNEMQQKRLQLTLVL